MVAIRVFLYNLCYNENSKDRSDNLWKTIDYG